MSRSPWTWPRGARAAISLTYDDGNPNNLDQAMPDLEVAGFRGTFYLHLARPDVRARAADWRSAHERGHEIGSHTWYHNCRVGDRPRPAWVTKPLEEYTGAAMAAEIGRCADWLDQHIGADADRSFAYPCGDTAIGSPPDSAPYAAAIATRHRFVRNVGNLVNDPSQVNLTMIQSFCFGTSNQRAEFEGACRAGRAAGGWVCLCFHGIGGPSHSTERSVHQELLRYLGSQPFWVAPLKEVARHIERRRATAAG